MVLLIIQKERWFDRLLTTKTIRNRQQRLESFPCSGLKWLCIPMWMARKTRKNDAEKDCVAIGQIWSEGEGTRNFLLVAFAVVCLRFLVVFSPYQSKQSRNRIQIASKTWQYWNCCNRIPSFVLLPFAADFCRRNGRVFDETSQQTN